MEFSLKLTRSLSITDLPIWVCQNPYLTVCHSGLRSYFIIPRGVKTITVNFSDKPPKGIDIEDVYRARLRIGMWRMFIDLFTPCRGKNVFQTTPLLGHVCRMVCNKLRDHHHMGIDEAEQKKLRRMHRPAYSKTFYIWVSYEH